MSLDSIIESLKIGDLKNAKRIIKDLVKSNVENVEFLTILGFICQLQDNHKEAQKIYSTALRINPSNYSASRNYIFAALIRGNSSDVEDLIHMGLTQSTIRSHWLGLRGIAKFQNAEYESGLSDLHVSVKDDPDDWEFLEALGRTFLHKFFFDIKGAHWAFSKSLKRNSENPNVLAAMARITLFSLQECAIKLKSAPKGWITEDRSIEAVLEQCEHYVNSALKMNPENQEACTIKAIIDGLIYGKFKDAKADLDKANKLGIKTSAINQLKSIIDIVSSQQQPLFLTGLKQDIRYGTEWFEPIKKLPFALSFSISIPEALLSIEKELQDQIKDMVLLYEPNSH